MLELITAKFFFRYFEDKSRLHCEINTNGLVETILVPDTIEANDDFINEHYCTRKTPFSEFDNEIYFYYYLKHINNIHNILEAYSVNQVETVGKHISFEFIKSYCLLKGVKVKGPTINDYIDLLSFARRMRAGLTLFISSIYASLLPIRYKKTSNKDYQKPFSLIHSKSSFRNISNVFGKEVVHYYDPLNQVLPANKHHVPLFSLLNARDILSNLVTFPLKSFKLFFKVIASGDSMLGRRGSSLAAQYFASRISHYILIEACYEKIFSRSTSRKYYSGEKESRYGVLAQRLGRLYDKTGIAIPHGMAFGHKYPHGLFGDRYYCLTEFEAEYLSRIYDSPKFIFDADITQKMYSFNRKNSPKMVVFFTEPRNIQVNFDIISLLQKILPIVHVQLHPLDKKEDYILFTDVEFLNDYQSSISGNICLARKSTILLEALYNNSIPISVLIDAGDRYDYENTFPALQSELIKKTYDEEQLIDMIKAYDIKLLNNSIFDAE